VSQNDNVTAQALQKLGKCRRNECLKRKAFRRLENRYRRCWHDVLGQTVPSTSSSNRKGLVADGGQPCATI